MPRLTAGGVAGAASGRVVGDEAAGADTVVADSRDVTPRAAFCAVRGGHAFTREAIDRGAPFVLVSREDAIPAGATGVVVGDTVAALGAVATELRTRLGARVVGITGSTGKTLTKDFLTAALSARLRVHAAPKSYNAELGVPLVVLSCADDADVMVAELAARHTGEIAELCAIVRPDVGIVTGIGEAHLGEFGSRAAIAATKGELPAALPADGCAILPSDDDYLGELTARTPARVVTAGPGGHVRYGASGVAIEADRGVTRGWVAFGSERLDITLSLAGRPLMRNAAMAIAAAVECGVPAAEAAAAIPGAAVSGWRLQVERVAGRTVVNDAYNANPTSVAAALRTVHELAGDRERWAVLGVMAELGAGTVDAHTRVGRLASGLGYTRVVAVGRGDGVRAIAAAASERGRTAADVDEAAAIVAREAAGDAFVLVKGSRVAGLEVFGAALARVRQGTGA